MSALLEDVRLLAGEIGQISQNPVNQSSIAPVHQQGSLRRVKDTQPGIQPAQLQAPAQYESSCGWFSCRVAPNFRDGLPAIPFLDLPPLPGLQDVGAGQPGDQAVPGCSFHCLAHTRDNR